MAEEEAPPSPTSSNSNSRHLHSKIRIKSCISDLANLVGEITEVKRGGWFMTDNPKIVRPIRAREFDLVNDDDNEGETKDGEGVKKDDDDEEASHFSAGNKDDDQDDADNKDNTTDAAEDKKEPQKEEGDDDEEEEELSDEEKVNPEDSNNYDKDQFLQLGTTIKITSGEHKGRTCTISERRVGIFLKIAVGGDIRLMQPDEIEVIKFAADPPFEEEKKSGKKEKDFGHRKYIGASVRVAGAAGEAGRKQRGKEATVDNAFSGEWYLVSDPDIVKALDPAQFEVVTKVEGGKRKRDDDDYDSTEEEEEEEEEVTNEVEEGEDASDESNNKSSSTEGQGVQIDEANEKTNWEGFDEDMSHQNVKHEPEQPSSSSIEAHDLSEAQGKDDYEGDGFGVMKYKLLRGKGEGGKSSANPFTTIGSGALVAAFLLILSCCLCCLRYRRRRYAQSKRPSRGNYAALGRHDFFNGTFSDDVSYGKDSDDDISIESYGSDDGGHQTNLEMGGFHEFDANGGLTLEEING
mmetsp:Transcript_25304/g.39269  ORF Transcript_25304/g.39269 Transcript_25304/m.39269 type:complete len:520 (+) Transcript_25304:95-1654(+)